MNKGSCTINYKFIWNINKIINYFCLVVLLICLSFINYNLLYCYFINYKIINCYLAKHNLIYLSFIIYWLIN